MFSAIAGGSLSPEKTSPPTSELSTTPSPARGHRSPHSPVTDDHLVDLEHLASYSSWADFTQEITDHLDESAPEWIKQLFRQATQEFKSSRCDGIKDKHELNLQNLLVQRELLKKMRTHLEEDPEMTKSELHARITPLIETRLNDIPLDENDYALQYLSNIRGDEPNLIGKQLASKIIEANTKLKQHPYQQLNLTSSLFGYIRRGLTVLPKNKPLLECKTKGDVEINKNDIPHIKTTCIPSKTAGCLIKRLKTELNASDPIITLLVNQFETVESVIHDGCALADESGKPFMTSGSEAKYKVKAGRTDYQILLQVSNTYEFKMDTTGCATPQDLPSIHLISVIQLEAIANEVLQITDVAIKLREPKSAELQDATTEQPQQSMR